MNFSEDAKNLKGSPMFQMLARVEELENAGRDIIHFEIGDPDFDTPRHIIDAAINALNNGDTHYVNSLGLAELRDAVCQVAGKELGWKPSRDQVVIAPTISFIYFVVRALLNRGEEVVVTDPGYSSYFSAFDFIGVRYATVPVFEKNNFRLKAEDLEKAITPKSRLLILNSPQNPTGAMMPGEDLEKIYQVAKKHNLYILSDEVYAKLAYGRKHESISINDHCRERVIIINGFSKAYAMTGWRLGYAIAPEEIVEKLGLMVETVFSNVPPFIQRAGIAALAGSQENVEKMVSEYKRRRDAMVRGLNDLPGVSCIMPDGAFYAFPNITKTGLSSREFAEFALDKAGVALLPGSDFGSFGEGYARVTFTTPLEKINEGMQKLKKALQNNKK